MADFQLDTSGAVILPFNASEDSTVYWKALSPFQQGYVRAALSHTLMIHFNEPTGELPWKPMETRAVRFSDLAPETLAAMLKDCAAFQVSPGNRGEDFWAYRQAGKSPLFPPVTLYLRDDGLIYQREAA